MMDALFAMCLRSVPLVRPRGDCSGCVKGLRILVEVCRNNLFANESYAACDISRVLSRLLLLLLLLLLLQPLVLVS